MDKGEPLSKEESGAKHHETKDITQKEPTEKDTFSIFKKYDISSYGARRSAIQSQTANVHAHEGARAHVKANYYRDGTRSDFVQDAPRWALTTEKQKAKLRLNGSAYAIANYNEF